MKLTNVTKLCLLGTSLLFSSLSTNAAEPQNLADILVTASRTPITSEKTGTSHTIITAEQIKQRQAIHVSDLLRDVPGIAVSRSGGIGGQTQIRMRGAEANQVLVLIDGIEANDPAQSSEFDFAHLLTSDIERIEIIRGPQSSLWGSDAMAGVINIITKQAGEGTRLSGLLEMGSFATAHGNVGVSDRGENYHVSLNGNFIRSDGTNVSEHGDEDDGYKNATINFKGGLNPLDNLDLSFVVRHTTAKKQFDPTPFPSFLPSDADRESENQQTYALTKAKLDLFEGAWQHIASIAFTNTDNNNFANGVETSTTEGQKLKFGYQSNVFFNTPSFADAAHTFTFAVESEREEFKQTGTASPSSDPNQKQDFTNIGYVVEYRLGLWDQLFTSISARYDDNDEFDDAKTYRGTIAYNIPNLGTTLRAAYGTAVKNPTFSDRFGYSPNTFIGNPDLDPEKSKGWEIGIDQKLFNDRIVVSATHFRERLEDEITGLYNFVTGTSSTINIDGKSEREGVEFSLRAFVNESLSINGSYTYVDSTKADSAGKQNRQIRRPEHIASLNTNYRFMNNKANLNLGIDYNGEQTDTDFSSGNTVTLDDYILVNVAAEYSVSKNITLFGRIENLFDESYRDVFGYNTPGIAGYAGIKMNLDL